MHGFHMHTIAIAMNAWCTMSDLMQLLAKWHPNGDFTEEDLWDAIAEVEGVDVNEISDRDLTEFI